MAFELLQIQLMSAAEIGKYGMATAIIIVALKYFVERLNSDKKEREENEISKSLERQRFLNKDDRQYEDIKRMHVEASIFRESVIEKQFKQTAELMAILTENNKVLQENHKIFNRIFEHAKNKFDLE